MSEQPKSYIRVMVLGSGMIDIVVDEPFHLESFVTSVKAIGHILIPSRNVYVAGPHIQAIFLCRPQDNEAPVIMRAGNDGGMMQ